MTAVNEAKLASARTALRDAVAEMEHVHTPGGSRDEPWRGLVDRRWAVIDHHERDGRHYLLVVGTPPIAPGVEILARRELQVVAAAAVGQSTKVIAYELGLRDSTVRVLLARSAKKLGVRTRAELVELYRAHVDTAK